MASFSTISTKATSEQTALKPRPMSRKVLASAGVAAFVLNTQRAINTVELKLPSVF